MQRDGAEEEEEEEHDSLLFFFEDGICNLCAKAPHADIIAAAIVIISSSGFDSNGSMRDNE